MNLTQKYEGSIWMSRDGPSSYPVSSAELTGVYTNLNLKIYNAFVAVVIQRGNCDHCKSTGYKKLIFS